MASVTQNLLSVCVCLTINFTGVDNVLEITIVTADGDHVISNAYRNKDLFWALRGGGGGTWGVVTSVTYKTHPSTPFFAAFIYSIPQMPTQPRSCSRRSFVSLPRSLSKVMEAMVAEMLRYTSSLSYHPTSPQNRPMQPSSRFSNLHIPNQVSPFTMKLLCSKIGGSSMMLHIPGTLWSVSRLRFHLGYCPKMSSRPINLKHLLKNSSSYLHSDICEFFLLAVGMDS